MRRTHANTLSAYWSKRERDLMFNFPDSSSNGGLLHSFFSVIKWPGDKSLVEELEARGYDVKTLRFSVMKKAP